KQIDSFTIVIPGGDSGSSSEAMRRGQIIADSQNQTRNLANEPANKLTPGGLAEAAKQASAEAGLACEVLDRDAMAKLGMGALLGVAQGSSNPPFLIVIKYRPSQTTGDHH